MDLDYQPEFAGDGVREFCVSLPADRWQDVRDALGSQVPDDLRKVRANTRLGVAIMKVLGL